MYLGHLNVIFCVVLQCSLFHFGSDMTERNCEGLESSSFSVMRTRKVIKGDGRKRSVNASRLADDEEEW